MTTATPQHIDTIRAKRYDDLARTIQATGIRLTHDQADAIGDLGDAWLTQRLGLMSETTDRAVLYAPQAAE